MSEPTPDTATLLREASEKLAEALDKLDAAQLLAQEQNAQIRQRFGELVRAVQAMSQTLEEIVL